jgi:hypothetical protein
MRNVHQMTTSKAGATGSRGFVAATKTTKTP